MGVPAHAQTSTSDTGASSQIEELVVTARKRQESLTDIPLAVSAYSEQGLDKRGVIDFASLSNFAPGLKFESQSVNRKDRGFYTFVMRGMFPGYDGADRQAVTVFIDGIPIASGAMPGLSNIERIEVIPGPQSAYFGRATFAGAISIISKDPSFDYGGDVSLQYSSYNSVEYKGGVEGAIIPDLLAVRLAGRYYDLGSHYDNPEFGGRLGSRNTKAVTGSVLFTPGALKVKSTLSVWKDNDGPSANGLLYAADFNCAANPANTARNYICGEINAPDRRIGQNTTAGQLPIDVLLGNLGTSTPLFGNDFIKGLGLVREAYQWNSSAEYSFDNGFTVNALYGKNSNEWAAMTDTMSRNLSSSPNPNFGRIPNVMPYYVRLVHVENDIASQFGELRINSPDDKKLSYLFGVSYFDQSVTLRSGTFSNSGFAIGTQPYTTNTETLGFFGSASYKFTDQITLNVEGRYQIDKVDQRVLTATGVSADLKAKSFTPRIILDYKPTPDITLYASYSKGTRPGAFNTSVFSLPAAARDEILAQLPVELVVDEEYVDMYEMGLKGEFFDRRLRLMSAIYYGQWRDQHILQTVFFNNNGRQSLNVALANGATDLYGVEVQANLRATENLSFDFNGSYAESEIVQTFCVACQAITGNAYPIGNRLMRYPAFSGTLGGEYTFQVMDAYDGFLRLEAIYTGKQFDTDANLAWTGANTKVNARLGISDERYGLELFATNLFNDDTPLSLARSTDAFAGGNVISFSAADPRMVGVRFTAKY
jgi:iron complex outermembrane receptor protein